MFASDRSIERLIREEFAEQLPAGFAERIAAQAFADEPGLFWTLVSRLSARASVALAAVSIGLLLFGTVGDGPGVIDSIDSYISSFDLTSLL